MKNNRDSFLTGLKDPNPFVIIALLIVFAVILTWIIPSGSFERIKDPVTERTIIQADSFTYQDDKKVNMFSALKAIPKGIIESGSIISFIFIISGSIEIIKATGALDSFILYLVNKFKNKDRLLLVIITIVFSLFGSIFGFAEETIPFIPLGISISLALGYDKLVGFNIVRTAAWIGYAASTLNPFSIGISQNIAELPLFSGLGYRILIYFCFTFVGLKFILDYAASIRKDTAESLSNNASSKSYIGKDTEFTLRHKLVLIIFAVNLIIMIIGTVNLKWYTIELSALFLVCSIIAGFVGGFSPNEIAENLSKGFRSVSSSALIVGFARAIVIVLEEGLIIDTIIYNLSLPLLGLSKSLAAIGMFFIQSIFNFFVGSSSGQAAITMPLMVPLADVLGVTRQTAVLAFQFGDGITNMIWPSMIYYLAFADITYSEWVKHINKLVIKLSFLGMIFVFLAQVFSYGPF